MLIPVFSVWYYPNFRIIIIILRGGHADRGIMVGLMVLSEVEHLNACIRGFATTNYATRVNCNVGSLRYVDVRIHVGK